MLGKIVFSLILYTACFSSFAYQTSRFEGKVTNHSSINLKEVSISYGLACIKPGVYESSSCGSASVEVKPNHKGVFVIPELRIKVASNKKKFISSWFSVSINERSIGNSTAISRESACSFDPDCSFKLIKSKLQNISLIEIRPLKVKPVFSSGISHIDFYSYYHAGTELDSITDSTISAIFLRKNGRNYKTLASEVKFTADPSYALELHLDVFLITELVEESDEISLTIRSQHTGCSKLQKSNFDTVVNYSISKGYSKDDTVLDVLELNYSDVFSINGKSCASYKNDLTGEFRFYTDFITPSIASDPKGYCFFDFKVFCENGLLTGQVELSSDLRCSLNREEPSKVNGTCQSGTYEGAVLNYDFGGNSYTAIVGKKPTNGFISYYGKLIDNSRGTNVGNFEVRRSSY